MCSSSCARWQRSLPPTTSRTHDAACEHDVQRGSHRAPAHGHHSHVSERALAASEPPASVGPSACQAGAAERRDPVRSHGPVLMPALVTQRRSDSEAERQQHTGALPANSWGGQVGAQICGCDVTLPLLDALHACSACFTRARSAPTSCIRIRWPRIRCVSPASQADARCASQLVKDHRTGVETSDVDGVLGGDLEQCVQCSRAPRRAWLTAGTDLWSAHLLRSTAHEHCCLYCRLSVRHATCNPLQLLCMHGQCRRPTLRRRSVQRRLPRRLFLLLHLYAPEPQLLPAPWHEQRFGLDVPHEECTQYAALGVGDLANAIVAVPRCASVAAHDTSHARPARTDPAPRTSRANWVRRAGEARVRR